jgi:hypothetical protein
MNNHEQVIKNYLETQIVEDAALREKYDPKKLSACYKYIVSQARKQADNGCAMIEDAVVYKWARDFYLEGLQNEEPEEEETPENEKKPIPHYKEKKEVFTQKDGVTYDSDGNGMLF